MQDTERERVYGTDSRVHSPASRGKEGVVGGSRHLLEAGGATLLPGEEREERGRKREGSPAAAGSGELPTTRRDVGAW